MKKQKYHDDESVSEINKLSTNAWTDQRSHQVNTVKYTLLTVEESRNLTCNKQNILFY